MKKISDFVAIIASILAIILSMMALYENYKTSEKTERVQKGLSKLTQETMYLAYYTKILAPENGQIFNQQYVRMEVVFGRDLNPSDHIWIVGFDGNNNYPLKKIEMAKGQRAWFSNIELPHMKEWILNIYQVDSENSKILKREYENKKHLDELSSSIFSFLGSVKVIYSDKRGN